MSASLLYRWFGVGRIPRPMRPVLDGEGVVLEDEGVSGTVTFRNFRAPGRRYSSRKSWFLGSLVITEIRFAGFAFRRPVVNVPIEGAHVEKLDVTLEKDGAVLCVGFEYADFNDDGSGRIEVRFRTDKAGEFHNRLHGGARDYRVSR